MSCSFSFSKSNSGCFPSTSTCFSYVKKLNIGSDVCNWADDSRTLADAQRLSFLDQKHPEPQLLRIECERLKVNRPFVQADRDPANTVMGFAPSALRRRSTAFVDSNPTQPSKLNPRADYNPPSTPFKMHMKA